jgi:perosamine synthetase
MSLVKKVTDTLEELYQEVPGPYHLNEPELTNEDTKAVSNVVKSGWVSYASPQVNEFEKKIAKTCDRKYAVATVSGTAALHIAYRLAGVEQYDELLMPALTFVATANAARYCGAIPHFVDSEFASFGICAEKLDLYLKKISRFNNAKQLVNKKTGNIIRAIVTTHILGHPSDDDLIKKVASKYRLKLIVDASESLGSMYKNKPAQKTGIISVVSFNGNKIITTGGGGAILTDNKQFSEKATKLITTNKLNHKWDFIHHELGYNYRMPGLNASLGISQLNKLNKYTNKKRLLANKIKNSIKDIEEISFFEEAEYAKSNYWLNAFILNKGHAKSRNALLAAMHSKNIFSRPLWELMSSNRQFKDNPSDDLSNSSALQSRVICLPSSVKLIR